MTQVYVGLGSNLDQPKKQIADALVSLDGLANASVTRHSSLYQSKPVGPQGQSDYINAVAEMETTLPPLDLLKQLQSIEMQQGRVRGKVRWGPRTLDLDLLLYGDKKINKRQLIIPHPEMQNRDFVLIPLSELVPDLVIPGLGPLARMITTMPGSGLVRLT